MDPRLSDVADQLLLIERELRVLGWWAEVPPSEEALSSQEPFCVDTLAFEQWLQWIFLPRMKLILESGHDLPQASGIRPMAEMAYRERPVEVRSLLDALGEFDRLIG
ncbi:YqcC family protein [Pseudomonas tohonis]|uniref:YqcC family protein n=1 Tax=Pseudomonas tohonis TaxID=2725477 RepID=UPI001F2A1AA2|nr:YqcC family protein [Pseudomonas tohonis]